MTAVPDLQITLANGTQVPWTEFKTWSAIKQQKSLVPTVVSQQHREAIRAANKGKKRTPEHRATISALHKGKTISEEQRALLSSVHKGKTISEEQRAQMRHYWQTNPHPRCQSKTIMTPTGEFPSLMAAARWAEQNGLGNARNKIVKWMKTHPDQFYYVEKVTK
jgi:hypothetical protein